MYKVYDYVHEFGNLPYSSLPFGPGDSYAICSALYMPVEHVVTDEKEKEPAKTFGQVANEMYAYYDYQIVPPGFLLNKYVFLNFLDLVKYSRFGSMKITGVKSVYDAEKICQFCGITMFVDDDTVLVVFRGTDDSIVGWREDFDILAKNNNIPSHKLSVDYLEDVAKTYPDKKIIVAGHSKGGYIALYACLNCSEETRKRIVKIYNNEGQGLVNKDGFNSPEYREILPKYVHTVPANSVVGMLYYHDNDYQVVKSSHILGALQHDETSWLMKGNLPDTQEELSFFGKVHDEAFEKLMSVFDDKETLDVFYNLLVKALYAPGQRGLLGISKNLASSLAKINKTLFNLTGEERKVNFKVLSSMTKYFCEAVTDQGVKEVKKLGSKKKIKIQLPKLAAD